VAVEGCDLVVYLETGDRIRAPLARYERLREATPAQRESFRLIARGSGIHWPDIDEDLSIAGLLRDFGIDRPRDSGVASRAR